MEVVIQCTFGAVSVSVRELVLGELRSVREDRRMEGH